MNFKQIHIGKLIEQRVKETEIEASTIYRFFNCNNNEIAKMYEAENLSSDIIMKWCKLLEYDFFRIYTQHLILYSPINSEKYKNSGKISLPVFRKNIYTREVIGFILELIRSGKKTKRQIVEEYNIPKTTVYKWIQKYNTEDEKQIK